MTEAADRIRPIRRVLVANRGEIAVRVIRTLREMGIASLAVCSEADRDARHMALADEGHLLGGNALAESYLNQDRLLAVARAAGADAVHPGYGFLAENADFAARCAEAGLVFLGPPPGAIRAMGSKIAARARMAAAGVPVVPGAMAPVADAASALAVAEAIGWPVALKASAAGGGKGFRIAEGPDRIAAAFEGAAAEGQRFFGDGTVYVERYLRHPRHVEVQVLADSHGNVIHLGERDCTVQRRHQKLIEEAPAPFLAPALRQRIGEIAVTAARAIGYVSAGTVEGLVADGDFYFLEMNTRLQVEHPVTEMITGIDIVRQQVAIGEGRRLAFRQEDIAFRGHAIECRINAEDASRNFVPRPGRIASYREPGGPFVRIDSGVVAGDTVSPFYDPLLAKLVVWGEDRAQATARMQRALYEFQVEGIATLLPFHRAYLATSEWRDGGTGHELLADRAFLRGLAGDDGATGDEGRKGG